MQNFPRLGVAVLLAASLSNCFYVPAGSTNWEPMSPVNCTPGTTLSIGCSDRCGLGSCTGDPVLRLCDGTSSSAQCADGVGQIRENDDATCTGTSSGSSFCPAIQGITCPSSGRITVITRSFSTSRGYTCSIAVQ